MNTPRQALDQYLLQHKGSGLNHAVILPDVGDANGGYFMAVALPKKHYDVFYTSLHQGHWIVHNLHFPQSGNSDSEETNVSLYAVVIFWPTIKPKVKTVVGYQQFGIRPIPFQFVQVGHLPIWGYRVTNGEAMTRAEGPENGDVTFHVTFYDHNGNVVVNSWHG